MAETQRNHSNHLRLAENVVPGIALSSGGALGISHIGVLNTLISAGIHFPIIAGTSIGAIVGAAYACGTLELAEEMARSLTRQAMLQWADLHWNGGVLKGDVVESLLRKLTNNLTFEDLRSGGITLVVVACDLNTGKPVYISEGDIASAVRASMSIPGVFVPVEMNGSNLVDGGLVDSIPVNILSRLGAGFTVGVDVSNTNDMWSRAKLGFMTSARTADQLWERIRGIASGAANAGSRHIEKYHELVSRFFSNTLGASATDGLKEAYADHNTKETLRTEDETLSPKDKAGNGSALDWAGLRAIMQSAGILTQNFDMEQGIHASIPRADILLRPDIRPFHAHQFYKAKELIEAGETAVHNALLNFSAPGKQLSGAAHDAAGQ